MPQRHTLQELISMPHAYTEDQLVEQPAIGLFGEVGWTTVSVLEETFGATGTLLRETKGEVVLVSRLRAALERLNPSLPPEAIATAVDELTRDRSAMSLEAANREVYLLLKESIKVSVPDTGTDSTPHPGPLPGRSGEGGGALGTARRNRIHAPLRLRALRPPPRSRPCGRNGSP